ncbi:MAG TPA: hypothetical protein VFI14_09290 [Chryseosolibacter sp.]|nr:hypothetical protein [Chryseosolibacter sp.]
METKSLLRAINWMYAASAVALVATMAMIVALLASCEPVHSEEKIAINYSKEDLVARGKYLVNTSGCHAVHASRKYRI